MPRNNILALGRLPELKEVIKDAQKNMFHECPKLWKFAGEKIKGYAKNSFGNIKSDA